MCELCDDHLQTKIKLAIFLASIKDGSLRAYRNSVAARPCLNVGSRNAVVRVVDKLLEAEPAATEMSKIAEREIKEFFNAENN